MHNKRTMHTQHTIHTQHTMHALQVLNVSVVAQGSNTKMDPAEEKDESEDPYAIAKAVRSCFVRIYVCRCVHTWSVLCVVLCVLCVRLVSSSRSNLPVS